MSIACSASMAACCLICTFESWNMLIRYRFNNRKLKTIIHHRFWRRQRKKRGWLIWHGKKLKRYAMRFPCGGHVYQLEKEKKNCSVPISIILQTIFHCVFLNYQIYWLLCVDNEIEMINKFQWFSFFGIN